MLEPNAKSGGFPYLRERENEISADTHGLPIWYFKPVVSYEPMQAYFDKFIELRNAGKLR